MLTRSAIMYHSLRICGTCINVSNGHSSTSKQQRSPPLLEDSGWNVSKRNQVKIVVMRYQIIILLKFYSFETVQLPLNQENINLGNKTHSNRFYMRHDCSLSTSCGEKYFSNIAAIQSVPNDFYENKDTISAYFDPSFHNTHVHAWFFCQHPSQTLHYGNTWSFVCYCQYWLIVVETHDNFNWKLD